MFTPIGSNVNKNENKMDDFLLVLMVTYGVNSAALRDISF